MKFTFPFGSQLQKVEQKDRNHKEIFVLGVYASAVHAKWIDIEGKVKVNALAVASEPYIFWKGDNPEQIINKIQIPKELGTLVPADKNFNGPSGNALDELFLKPLGYTRDDAWLCDLLPYSRINPNQKKAIFKHYNPVCERFNLPECTIPEYKPSELNNGVRVEEILSEFELSKARIIITLGDLPIKHFLSYFSEYKILSDFGNSPKEYGKEHPIKINGKTYQVIPLVHPRQAAALGRSSFNWNKLHEKWIQKMTNK